MGGRGSGHGEHGDANRLVNAAPVFMGVDGWRLGYALDGLVDGFVVRYLDYDRWVWACLRYGTGLFLCCCIVDEMIRTRRSDLGD